MLLRNNLVLWFMGLSFVILSSSCKNDETEKVKYESPYGISLMHPTDWTIAEDEQDESVPILIKKNENVGEDDFNSNINLYISSYKGSDMDFDKLMHINKNYLILNKIKLEDERLTKIDGHPAYKIAYQRNYEGDELKVVQYLQFYNEMAHTITFVCKLENFKKLEEEATGIIESFTYDFNKK